MTEPFRVRFTVRAYELDTQGHLASAVYVQYGDHAHRECLRAAGAAPDRLRAAGIGLVTLETTIRFRRELRADDEVTVSCAFVWREGKTYRLEQEFRRRDATLVAELTGLVGLVELAERKLVADPAARLRTIATNAAILGL